MAQAIDKQFDWLGDAPVEYRFYHNTVSVFYSDAEHSYIRYDETGQVIIPGVTTAVHIIDKSAALTQWAANMACNHVRTEAELYLLGTGADWRAFSTVQLEEWLLAAKYAHRNYKEKAGETGHVAHDWIEQLIKGLIKEDWNSVHELLGNLPEDDRARNGCIAALDWMAKHTVRFVFTERKIYSRRHDFAGTLDGLAYVSSCGDKDCCGEIEDMVKVAATFKDVLAIIDWKTSNALYDEYGYQTAAYTYAVNEELGLGVKLRFIIRLGKEDAQFESKFLPAERLQDDVEIFLGCLTLHRAIDRRKAADKEFKDAVKAAAKAAKQAAEDAAKAHKAAYKAALRTAKANNKIYYKQYRDMKLSVAVATARCADLLVEDLATINTNFGMVEDEEEELEIAA